MVGPSHPHKLHLSSSMYQALLRSPQKPAMTQKHYSDRLYTNKLSSHMEIETFLSRRGVRSPQPYTAHSIFPRKRFGPQS